MIMEDERIHKKNYIRHDMRLLRRNKDIIYEKLQ